MSVAAAARRRPSRRAQTERREGTRRGWRARAGRRRDDDAPSAEAREVLGQTLYVEPEKQEGCCRRREPTHGTVAGTALHGLAATSGDVVAPQQPAQASRSLLQKQVHR